MVKKNKVLIAGGGTGGHVIPALAIGRELRDKHGCERLPAIRRDSDPGRCRLEQDKSQCLGDARGLNRG